MKAVYVFKGANTKATVIRSIMYDLLFNNMNAMVLNTTQRLQKKYEQKYGEPTRKSGVKTGDRMNCSILNNRVRFKEIREATKLRKIKALQVQAKKKAKTASKAVVQDRPFDCFCGLFTLNYTKKTK